MKTRRMLILILTIASPAIMASTPLMMNYQGMLNDSNGNPVADNDYTLTFTIYDAPTGGNVIWDEKQAVRTVEGQFRVLLGTVTPIVDTVFNATVRYLGLQVGTDPEITPRIMMVTVPYAFRVNTIDGASGGSVTGDVDITGKVKAGPNVTNSGRSAFATGENSSASGRWSTAGGAASQANGDWSTVSGGQLNTASRDFTTIGGGANNNADGYLSTVSGGTANVTSDTSSVVSGGKKNVASGVYSSIGGGKEDTASGMYSTIGGGTLNLATDTFTTIGGGELNKALANGATIAGGRRNVASGGASTIAGGVSDSATGLASAVAGGIFNKATATYSAVGGGGANIATDTGASVSGGFFNKATGNWSHIGGGKNNLAGGESSVVAGGGGVYQSISGLTFSDSNVATGNFSFVGGGNRNRASGEYSIVPGGEACSATGDYSFAAGRYASAIHYGAFVWNTETFSPLFPTPFTSDTSFEFAVRASGGFRFVTNVSLPITATGVTLSPGGSSWNSLSDSTLKQNVREVHYENLLDRINALPISRWSYKAQPSSVEHIGPMAQDFYRLFRVGEDDRHINTLDPDGIALAGIKALIKRNEILARNNRHLKDRLDALEQRLKHLEQE